VSGVFKKLFFEKTTPFSIHPSDLQLHQIRGIIPDKVKYYVAYGCFLIVIFVFAKDCIYSRIIKLVER
jgi:hypothetical protein